MQYVPHGSLGMVASPCLSSGSRDPVEVMDALMCLPGIHMHRPEHHVLVNFTPAYRLPQRRR